MTRTDEALERIAAIKEATERRRRHDNSVTALAYAVTIIVNLDWIWRGTESAWRAAVITLLTVIIVLLARRR